MNHRRSQELFQKAGRYLPGGVDSPVRAFKAVGGTPPFITRGSGSKIYDADGNEMIDYVCSWGPLILGHAHEQVLEALQEALSRGTSFGAPCELEIQLAEMISGAMPAMEMVRFVNSGTEAAMSVLRLARAFSGRDKIIKFNGCYHGHADGLLVQAGSGVATLSISGSPGVPASYVTDTLTAPYNDVTTVETLFERYPQEIAAVIVEPAAANMGLVPPQPGFLEGLRGLTRQYGALLIFDEVITGFRVSYGGAQELYGVTPDLTCLGKIIGGGLPVGAYGGRKEIMELVAPLGPVYQAGTLSGNPLAMTAGIKTLEILRQPDIYKQLEQRGEALERGVTKVARDTGIVLQPARIGSLFTVFFSSRPVTDYHGAQEADTAAFANYFHSLLEQGIYWPPSQFECAFLSFAHSEEDIERTVVATAGAMRSLAV